MSMAGYRTGLLLATIGGLTISFDVPAIRLAVSDPYTVMLVRGFGLTAMLALAWFFGRGIVGAPSRPLQDRDFLIVGIIYGISNIFFTLAVFNTSTANLLFILAFIPMIAALLAWAMIGERPRNATWITICLTISGVGLIVNEGFTTGGGWGELLSLSCATTMAYAIVHTRKSGKDLSLSPAIGGIVSLLFALPFVLQKLAWPEMPIWLLIDACIIIPIAMFTLALAPRFIPAAQSAMFFLLETVLAPIWVWMIFAEVPSQMTFIGGAIILFAIIGHSAWQLRQED